MMPIGQLTKMVVRNTLRSPKDFVLSALPLAVLRSGLRPLSFLCR